MQENILELITQALTENRIIDKVHQTEEYHKAKKKRPKHMTC